MAKFETPRYISTGAFSFQLLYVCFFAYGCEGEIVVVGLFMKSISMLTPLVL